MSYAGLHVHSDASDGTLSPEQVVRLAREAGLSAITLTDRDITAGVAGVVEAGAGLGLEVVPGIEVSSDFRDHEIHILGLFVDTDLPFPQTALKEPRHHRDQRSQEMLGYFDAHGIHLIAEGLCARSPDTVITGAHVTKALLTKGLGPDLDHIFRKYLQCGGIYCPPKEFLPPEAVMEALLDNRTFVALSHPFQYKLGDKATKELIAYLTGLGMKGLEIYHSSRNRLESAKPQEIATRHHLLSTGGSGFHGSNEPDISMGTGRGDLRVSSLLLDAIKNTL